MLYLDLFLFGFGILTIIIVMTVYYFYMASPSAIKMLDERMGRKEASVLRKPVNSWLAFAERIWFVPILTIIATILILGSWIGFPYVEPHSFTLLSWGAWIALVTSTLAWWHWAYLGGYKKPSRILNLGFVNGILWLVAAMEGTLGYFWWAFSAGYFLD